MEPTQEPIQVVLTRIDINLQVLGWAVVERSLQSRSTKIIEPRLLWWAVTALQRSGFDADTLFANMQQYPPEKHWWFLRQRLPEEAIRVLDAKLSARENPSKVA